MKGVIVFKGRYGATAQYANWLGSILQLPVYETDELSNVKLNGFDYIIAGTSVYVGKMLLAKWINAHEKILTCKKLFMFVVCATPSTEETQLTDLLKKNINPGLLKTIKVFYLRGRMIKSNLSFIDRLVLRMGAALQKNKSDKERMLTDFDDVRQENLTEILNAVQSFSFEIREPV
jgi:menaquinone-dependent protoporphyrinogen IX oxidase